MKSINANAFKIKLITNIAFVLTYEKILTLFLLCNVMAPKICKFYIKARHERSEQQKKTLQRKML